MHTLCIGGTNAEGQVTISNTSEKYVPPTRTVRFFVLQSRTSKEKLVLLPKQFTLSPLLFVGQSYIISGEANGWESAYSKY